MSEATNAFHCTVTRDTPCFSCGYNLRGLDVDGRCPECGCPVGRSVRGDFLRYADLGWLETVAKGTTVKLWAIAVTLSLSIVPVGTAAGGPFLLVLIPVLAADLMHVWAAWLITTPEPRLHLREEPVTLRKAIRLCAVLRLPGVFFEQCSKLVAGNAAVLLTIGGQVLFLAGIVRMLGELVYYRRFARRMPDLALERSTTVVLWGLPISYGATLVAGVTALLAKGSTATSLKAVGQFGMVGGGPVGCIGGVSTTIFSIWYVVLLFRYRRAFLRAAA